MSLLRNKYTPREMIQIGMAFFLLGIFVNMIADGRMIGALLEKYITDQSLLSRIHAAAAGVSIPIFCVSIYFNVSGLVLLRREKNG